jgi:hypothetical protein
MKLTPAGNVVWQTTIGGNGDDKLRTLELTADGGYICGGSSASDLTGDKTEPCFGPHDCWVIKLSSTGQIEWQNTIGGNKDEVIYDMHPLLRAVIFSGDIPTQTYRETRQNPAGEIMTIGW